MKREIGIRLATLRRNAGLSQSQIADRVHVCASTVGMYEQGRREPAIETLVALAALFEVSLDYLVTGRDALDIKSCTKAQCGKKGIYLREEECTLLVELVNRIQG